MGWRGGVRDDGVGRLSPHLDPCLWRVLAELLFVRALVGCRQEPRGGFISPGPRTWEREKARQGAGGAVECCRNVGDNVNVILCVHTAKGATLSRGTLLPRPILTELACGRTVTPLTASSRWIRSSGRWRSWVDDAYPEFLARRTILDGVEKLRYKYLWTFAMSPTIFGVGSASKQQRQQRIDGAINGLRKPYPRQGSHSQLSFDGSEEPSPKWQEGHPHAQELPVCILLLGCWVCRTPTGVVRQGPSMASDCSLSAKTRRQR